MHVSPFMEMDVDYDWRFRAPDERLTVHMANHRKGDKIFDATLDLERRPLTGPVLAGALASHPVHDRQGHGGDTLAGPETVAEGLAGPRPSE